jgi:hypothetical protein
VNRSTLAAFLFALAAIIGFSAVAGAVSLVWRPPTDRAAGNAKPARATNDSDDADDDEVQPGNSRRDYSRQHKNGTLHGQVTDSHTGEPVQGAEVSLDYWFSPAEEKKPGESGAHVSRVFHSGEADTKKTKSDVNGRYSLEIPPSMGLAQIRYQKENYFGQWMSVGFKDETNIDITLARAPWLTGKVTDSTGAPITKFRIEATTYGMFSVSTQKISRGYEGSDTFLLPIQNGTWDLTVSTDTNPRLQKSTRVTIGRDDVKLDFVLEPAKGSARGR